MCIDRKTEDLCPFWGKAHVSAPLPLLSGYFLYDTVHVAVWDQKFLEHPELL